MSARLIYVTCGSQDEARKIGEKIVKERLAACANIVPEIIAVFHWDGGVQSDTESLLLLKTRAELVPRLTERVLALHSYECPCVAELAIAPGNPAFFDWIAEETAAAGSG